MSPLAERYYRSWQTQRSVDGLERFLTGHSDLNAAQFLEVLLVDQALEWQYGPGPSVELYLQRFPSLLERSPAVLELVCGEMRAARALGLPIDVDGYAARFPDLAEPLRRQIEVSTWLGKEGGGTMPGDQPPS
jgi:hypothetical protein